MQEGNMRRQAIRYGWPLLLMAAVALGAFATALAADGKATKPASPAVQNDKSSDVPSLEPDSGHSKTAKNAKHDPTSAALDKAFAIPHSADLSVKQKDALKKLRTDLEPKLRAALEKAEKATETADKTAAASEIKKIRKDIKDGKDKILDMADEDAAKQQADALKKAQQAEAQRRAMQNQRFRNPYQRNY
jgi:hypothetical protein